MVCGTETEILNVAQNWDLRPHYGMWASFGEISNVVQNWIYVEHYSMPRLVKYRTLCKIGYYVEH